MQTTVVTDLIRTVLGADALGIYLYGSSVDGGARPYSDVDIFVVSQRPTTSHDKQRLVTGLLEISQSPRSVEVTIVVQSDIRPWQYPPRFDFLYGDWMREDFERGDVEPWPSNVNPDLAVLMTMVRQHHKVLHGQPPAELFDAVPHEDVARALVDGVDGLMTDLAHDTRNVLLTLARSWCTLATGEIRPKDVAAAWALERLPPDYKPVLAHARSVYLGEDTERWDDAKVLIGPCAQYLVGRIKKVAAG